MVSLIPAVTELMFAIGAGDRLVGRTRWGVHPPEARAVPDLGDGVRPSIEAIMAARPDLVFLYEGAGNLETGQRLEGLGVNTVTLRHDTLGDLIRNLEQVGSLTGCAGSARAISSRLRREFSLWAEAAAERARPRVYYDVWDEPAMTIGRGSFIDSLIDLAGGSNVFADRPEPSPAVSVEAIAARSPDLILFPVASSEDGGRQPPADRPGWTAIDAVAGGRVVRVDGDLVHRLGPRVGDAVAEIHRALFGARPGGGDATDLAGAGSLGRIPAVGPCRA